MSVKQIEKSLSIRSNLVNIQGNLKTFSIFFYFHYLMRFGAFDGIWFFYPFDKFMILLPSKCTCSLNFVRIIQKIVTPVILYFLNVITLYSAHLKKAMRADFISGFKNALKQRSLASLVKLTKYDYCLFDAQANMFLYYIL